MIHLKPLSDRQSESIRGATARINIWHGSVRSGKTIASLIDFSDKIANRTGHGDILIAGKTERTVKRNVIGPLQDLLGHNAVKLRQGIGEAVILGELVYLVGANDERAEGKIRGGTFELIYIDEGTLVPESFFAMCLTRMSPPGANLDLTTNPDGPMHWLKRGYLDREAELDMRSFHFTLRDNPDLSDEYIAALGAEFSGMWRKRFVDGLWVAAEGVIWDAFDVDRHVVDALPDDLEFGRYFVGIDYGTANPFVALLVGVGSDGRMWVLDEWRWDSRQRSQQLTDAQYSGRLGEWIAEHEIAPGAFYPDPSAASFILQLRQDHDWNVVDAVNDVSDGLRHVGTLIANDRLRVLSRCEGLIAEMATYAWDPKAQQRGEDKPVKQADHGPDALRYALYSDSLLDIGDLDQYGWVA